MRVLYVTHVCDLGGANRSMLQMIKELRANHRVEPYVLLPKSTRKLNKLAEECVKHEIPYEEYKFVTFKSNKTNLLYKLYFVLLQSCYMFFLFWRLRNEKFDFIHSNTSVNDTGAWLSILTNTMHVWHLREYGEKDFKIVSRLGRGYERWIYSTCKNFIAISESIKETFNEVIDVKNINVIYNGIVPVSCDLCAKHNGEVVQFCIVGRVEPAKNQSTVVLAAAELVNRGIRKFHISIIGNLNNKTYVEKIKEIIKNEGLEKYCELAGEKNNVSELLSYMDVGLMTSRCEAFGRVTVEYMMHEMAVIASNSGANKELVHDQDTGLIYGEYMSYEGLADCMQELLINRELMLRIASKGRAYAMSNFTSTNNSDKIYNLYQSLLYEKEENFSF